MGFSPVSSPLVLRFFCVSAQATESMENVSDDAPKTFQNDGVKPRTLEDIVHGDADFWDYLKKITLFLNLKKRDV